MVITLSQKDVFPWRVKLSRISHNKVIEYSSNCEGVKYIGRPFSTRIVPPPASIQRMLKDNERKAAESGVLGLKKVGVYQSFITSAFLSF